MKRSFSPDETGPNKKFAGTIFQFNNIYLRQIFNNLPQTQEKQAILWVPLDALPQNPNGANLPIRLNISVKKTSPDPTNVAEEVNPISSNKVQNSNGNVSNNLTSEQATDALFQAITEKEIELIKNAIAQGAKINAQNKYGSTVLHYASASGNIDIVKLLLEHQANPNIPDNNRVTPLGIAEANNRQGIQELLQKTVLCNNSVSSIDKGNLNLPLTNFNSAIELTGDLQSLFDAYGMN